MDMDLVTTMFLFPRISSRKDHVVLIGTTRDLLLRLCVQLTQAEGKEFSSGREPAEYKEKEPVCKSSSKFPNPPASCPRGLGA